jgi:hypothetical protein
MGDGLLVVSAPTAIADLPTLLAAARETPDPLRSLQSEILAQDAHAETRIWVR